MKKVLIFIFMFLCLPRSIQANEDTTNIVYHQIEETDQLWEEDKIDEAIQKITQTIPQIVKVFGKLSPEYVNYLDLASRIYQDNGDYNRALKIIDECLLLKNPQSWPLCKTA